MSSLSNSSLGDRDIGLCFCRARILKRFVHSIFVTGNSALEESKTAIRDWKPYKLKYDEKLENHQMTRGETLRWKM